MLYQPSHQTRRHLSVNFPQRTDDGRVGMGLAGCSAKPTIPWSCTECKLQRLNLSCLGCCLATTLTPYHTQTARKRRRLRVSTKRHAASSASLSSIADQHKSKETTTPTAHLIYSGSTHSGSWCSRRSMKSPIAGAKDVGISSIPARCELILW